MKAILEQTHEIDKRVFKSCDHYDEQALPDGGWTGWTDVNNDIYTFIVVRKTRRPIGYINAMPVTSDCFDAIVAGTKPDNELKPDDVLPYTPDSTLDLYLMSIAVDPAYQKTGHGLDSEALERLMNGAIGKLVHYAVHRNVRVGRIAAVGWTPIGRKLCQQFGMKQSGRDQFGNDIFQIDLRKPEASQKKRLHPGIKRLLAWYSQMA
jgi:hypothetical protein